MTVLYLAYNSEVDGVWTFNEVRFYRNQKKIPKFANVSNRRER